MMIRSLKLWYYFSSCGSRVVSFDTAKYQSQQETGCFSHNNPGGRVVWKSLRPGFMVGFTGLAQDATPR
jgi:hypothetical protein